MKSNLWSSTHCLQISCHPILPVKSKFESSLLAAPSEPFGESVVVQSIVHAYGLLSGEGLWVSQIDFVALETRIIWYGHQENAEPDWEHFQYLSTPSGNFLP